MKHGNYRKRAAAMLRNLVYGLVGAVMLLPIYYLVVTTFKTHAEAAARPLGLPAHFTLENYKNALAAMEYGRALRNNLIIAGCAVALLLVFASMAAYVIAAKRR